MAMMPETMEEWERFFRHMLRNGLDEEKALARFWLILDGERRRELLECDVVVRMIWGYYENVYEVEEVEW